ncbi:MAG: hypothetical protein AABY84_05845 [Candidatus Firestonebacteria bacterium]
MKKILFSIVIIIGITITNISYSEKVVVPTIMQEMKRDEELRRIMLIAEKGLDKWIKWCSVTIAKFDIKQCKKEKEESIHFYEFGPMNTEIYQFDKMKNKLEVKLYSYSPDKTKVLHINNGIFVNKKGEFELVGEPDSAVSFIDLKKGKHYHILFYGTMGGFNEMIWIDANNFIITASSWDEFSQGKIHYTPMLYFFSLSKNIMIQYRHPGIKTSTETFFLNWQRYFEVKFPNLKR